MAPKIVAGFPEDIKRDSGEWMIVDIGFSSNEPTCGVWQEDGQVKVITFGKLVDLAKRRVKEKNSVTLNLLIEAPLSVAFRENGNPVRRYCDKEGKKNRDWYVNAGATTLIAASYFLQALHESEKGREIKLFEGFVSFKKSNSPPTKKERKVSHEKDVLKLKKAVWHQTNVKIFTPDELQEKTCGHVTSAFPFFKESLIPPVLRIGTDPGFLQRIFSSGGN